jgi:hypothetical protein
VQAVNTKIADMQHRAEMRDLNRAFKAARKGPIAALPQLSPRQEGGHAEISMEAPNADMFRIVQLTLASAKMI